MLRVGLWGVGGHARKSLIPAFAATETVRLAAIHTRDADVLAEVAATTGAMPFPDVDVMLGSTDIDAVYLAVPTGIHFNAAMRAISTGKHVWCEKPLTESHEKTVELIDAATKAGLVALETDMFLHHPQFERLQTIVSSGDLGDMLSMTGRFGFPHRPTADFRYSRDLGGGAVLDAGFYPLAAAVALLGTGIELRGAMLQFAPEYEVDIGGSAFLTGNNRTAFLDWGFGRSYRSEIELWCERGTVHAQRAYAKPDDLDTEIVVRHQSGSVETLPVPAANHFALMLNHFAAVTSGDCGYQPDMLLARSRLMASIRDVGASGVED